VVGTHGARVAVAGPPARRAQRQLARGRRPTARATPSSPRPPTAPRPSTPPRASTRSPASSTRVTARAWPISPSRSPRSAAGARAQARLHQAARLHDVGKAVLPEALLTRPGPLSEPEREHVRRHARVGAELAAGALDAEQASWIRHHHERHDGTGYPDHLAGDAIPDGAALIATPTRGTR